MRANGAGTVVDYQIFADRGTLRYLGWEDRPPNREGS